MADLKNKRIITVATTGAWPKKENNPNVPLQPEEIAEEIYQCWKIGAAVAHVHVRDEEGNDSMKVETFKKVIDLVHENHPDSGWRYCEFRRSKNGTFQDAET